MIIILMIIIIITTAIIIIIIIIIIMIFFSNFIIYFHSRTRLQLTIIGIMHGITIGNYTIHHNLQLETEKLNVKRATKKEKEILKQLKVQVGKEVTSNSLKIAKEQWIVKLKYKKVKLEKCIEKRKRKQAPT